MRKQRLISCLLSMALVFTMMPLTSVWAEASVETVVAENELPSGADAQTEDDSVIIDSGTCGDNLEWTYDSNGILTISGEGNMEDYSSVNSAPWYNYIRKPIGQSTTPVPTKVIVEEGVTSIGSYAFYSSFDAKGDIELKLPEGLTAISQYAFYHSNVKSIMFPESLITIGAHAFDSSTITKAELNAGLENIYDGAFDGCTFLEKAIIPDTIETIPDSCFRNCSSLKEVELPDSVTRIGMRAFKNCSKLEQIDLPSELKTISSYAFEDCSGLKSICIPSKVDEIEYRAFNGCTNLSKVDLHENYIDVEGGAFYNCHSLKSVFIPSATTSFGSITSFGCCDDIIAGTGYQKIEGFKLYCLKGSRAVEDAIKYGTNYEEVDISIEERSIYNGELTIPTIKIIVGGETLAEKTDYMVECMNNTQVGIANATISFINGYAFLPNIKKEYQICHDITKCTISTDKDSYQYHDLLPEIQIEDGEQTLTCGKDYIIEYNIGTESWIKTDTSHMCAWDIGEGVAKITGLGEYAGACNVNFTVTKFDIANAKLMAQWIPDGYGGRSTHSFSIEHFNYDGTPKMQTGFILMDYNDEIDSLNYEVSFANNTNAGEATMLIKGTGKFYSGVLEREFSIYNIDLSACSIKLKDEVFLYDGKEKVPEVTVKHGGKILKQGIDYELDCNTANCGPGTASVRIVGIGNYIGTVWKDYKIVDLGAPRKVNVKLSGYDDITASWSRVDWATGYYVSWRKATSSKWSSPKYTTKASYKIANLTDGEKYYIRVYPCIKDSSGKIYRDGSYRTSDGIYTLKKVSSVKAIRSGSKVKVSWSNMNGESGYQISRSTSKSGTNIVKTYSTTSGKYTTVSATKGKTYYYKVRAYKTVNGTKIYGPWSTSYKYRR